MGLQKCWGVCKIVTSLEGFGLSQVWNIQYSLKLSPNSTDKLFRVFSGGGLFVDIADKFV